MVDPRDHERLRRLGDLAWPVAIWVLALAVRLICAWQYSAHTLGRQAWVDESAYLERARAIVAGAWLPARPFYQDPLLPYLLALPVAWLGANVGHLRLLGAVVGSLTPLAVYWAGKRGLGRAEGVVAGLAMALYAPLVFADMLLEKEGPAALLAAFALALAAETRSRTWRSAVAAGACGLAWGLVALLRANALLLAPLGAGWLLWCLGRQSPCEPALFPKRGRALAAILLLGFGLAIGPVVAINAAVGRPSEMIITTWQGGANFYVGNGPGATGTYHAPEFVVANPAFEADNFAAEASRRAGRPLTPGEISRFWLVAGLSRWRQQPLASLHLLAYKVELLLHNEEIPDSQDLDVVRALAAPALGRCVVSFGVLLPFAVIGIARPRPERSPFWWFLVASTAVGLGSTAFFFVVGRYRVPWAPGLALLAAAGVVDLARFLAARKWRPLTWRLLLLGLPAVVLAWRPLAEPAPDRWGHAEIGLALAYLAENQLEPAIDAFDDARALGPGPAGRVAEMLAQGPVHDKVAQLIGLEQEAGRRLGRVTPPLTRARWLRQLAEGRAESLRLLEVVSRQPASKSAALRERAAWLLAEPLPASRRDEAYNLLQQASAETDADTSAMILLVLLNGDKAPVAHLFLPHAKSTATLRDRVRLAQTILSERDRGQVAPRD